MWPMNAVNILMSFITVNFIPKGILPVFTCRVVIVMLLLKVSPSNTIRLAIFAA